MNQQKELPNAEAVPSDSMSTASDSGKIEFVAEITGVVVGRVQTLKAPAFVTRADGTRVELQLGDAIYEGDVIETGDVGGVGIVFLDESVLSMADNAKMVLDEAIYDASEQEGSLQLSALQGVFSVVSGLIAKSDPDAMVISTPVATIGIRGTQLAFEIGDGGTLEVVMLEEADGFVGEAVITNDGGVSLLDKPFQMVFVDSLKTIGRPEDLQHRQDVVEYYRGSLSVLPTVGTNANDYDVNRDSVLQEPIDLENLDTRAGGDEPQGAFSGHVKVVDDLSSVAGGNAGNDVTTPKTETVAGFDGISGGLSAEATNPDRIVFETDEIDLVDDSQVSEPASDVDVIDLVEDSEPEPIPPVLDVDPTSEPEPVPEPDPVPPVVDVDPTPEPEPIPPVVDVDPTPEPEPVPEPDPVPPVVDVDPTPEPEPVPEPDPVPPVVDVDPTPEPEPVPEPDPVPPVVDVDPTPEPEPDPVPPVVDASPEDDNINGTPAQDVLNGGEGDDLVKGKNDADLILGAAGDDRLMGNNGDDVLDGGLGDDILKGGGGDDILIGGRGDDVLTGGKGNDTFIFGGHSGSDRITDFKLGDIIKFEGKDIDLDSISIAQSGKDTVITIGNRNTEITLDRVDADELSSYSVTASPDGGVVISFDESQ